MMIERGSIELARALCVEIAGFTDETEDWDGKEYGSVDIAEILSAEVVRLRRIDVQTICDAIEKIANKWVGVDTSKHHPDPVSRIHAVTMLIDAEIMRRMRGIINDNEFHR
jgi:hypothetical protein